MWRNSRTNKSIYESSSKVNLLPKDFDTTISDPTLWKGNVRDRIKYILVPGERTDLHAVH